MRIAKQPNGKYAIWFNDQLLINQTEDDYYKYVVQEAKEKFDRHLEGVNTIIEKVTDDAMLKDMGFVQPHKELLKWIPKQVTNKSYASRDCITYGHCPACNEVVQDGIGGTDERCPKCGQVLKWGY